MVCLDDYHSLDRFGRKETGLTALDPKAQDFDTMYEQTQAIKDGKSIDKLIYNHVTGLLDPPETIQPPKVQSRLTQCSTSCTILLPDVLSFSRVAGTRAWAPCLQKTCLFFGQDFSLRVGRFVASLPSVPAKCPAVTEEART